MMESKIKVLFATRNGYLETKGGDTFQMLNTKKYIESHFPNISISVICEPSQMDNAEDFDILHIFNMQNINEALEYSKKAKAMGKRVALSPIYWDLSEAIYACRMAKLTGIMKIWELLHWAKPILNLNFSSHKYMGSEFKKKYIELLGNIDILLPNSDEEGEIIDRQFGVKGYKTIVIPNAIQIKPDLGADLETLPEVGTGFIMEAARIEPTKNQLALIKACKNKEIPIVIIGAHNKNYGKYLKKVEKAAEKRGNVYILGEMKPEQVAAYYRKAKVHALPSYRESPGLSSLEAMYYGANAVVSSRTYCPIDYYKFSSEAYVCNPYSVKSLSKAVEEAYNADAPKLGEDYFKFLSYDNVAFCMNEVYTEMMK